MPVKTRARSAKSAKPKQQSTQLGELDTTPTRHHFQSPQGQKQLPPGDLERGAGPSTEVNTFSSEREPVSQLDEFDDDLDDVDLIKLDCAGENKAQTTSHVDDFSWSEAGSLTRRSSPLRGGETPHDIWEFGESNSFEPFSSPRSSQEKLPDTIPLPPEPVFAPLPQPPEAERRIDFSETASTLRRSSPVVIGSTPENRWDFREVSSRGALPNLRQESQMPHSCPPASPLQHYPEDEIYDATPPRSRNQQPDSHGNRSVAAQRKKFCDPTPPQTLQRKNLSTVKAPKGKRTSLPGLVMADLASDDDEPSPCPEQNATRRDRTKPPTEQLASQTQEVALQPVIETTQVSPSAAQADPKGRKRKQRAKIPIQFDEATNEIKEFPQAKKLRPAPRQSIVGALKIAAESGSLIETTKKRSAPKSALKKVLPKKKQKPRPRTAGKRAPLSADKMLASGVGEGDASLPIQPMMQKAQMNKLTATHEELLNPKATIPSEPIMISSDDSSELSDLDISPPSLPPGLSSPGKDEDMNEVQAEENIELVSATETGQRSLLGRAQNGKSRNTISSSLGNEIFDPDKLHSDKAHQVEEVELVSPAKRITRGMRKKNSLDDTARSRVLAPRDPNLAPNRIISSPGNQVMNKKRITKNAGSISIQQGRKGSKLARSFSISEAGSPLPLGSDRTVLADKSKNWVKDDPVPTKD
ncbi:hypothetical protein BGZ63DRAFT_197471 [Mariannaea sp. PMI_226]|nr:hypothetical protein BGZ63DRAFT_197471 [Mariannaea sp. PMI_226]